VKVVTNPAPLESAATEAFYAAAEDVRQYVMRATVPVKSGKLRDSIRVNRRKRNNGPTARVGSRLPYAGVQERGGGPAAGWRARGPHVKRANASAYLRKGAEKFPALYEAQLRRTPVRSAAFVSHDFGGEVGLPSLELSGL